MKARFAEGKRMRNIISLSSKKAETEKQRKRETEKQTETGSKRRVNINGGALVSASESFAWVVHRLLNHLGPYFVFDCFNPSFRQLNGKLFSLFFYIKDEPTRVSVPFVLAVLPCTGYLLYLPEKYLILIKIKR